MSWVVDASITVKWLTPERLTENADRLLASGEPLIAPDLVFVEAANALWKKTQRREITLREATAALDLLRAAGLEARPTPPLLRRALELAGRLEHPVYDCVYLALAEVEHLPLVTADARLLRGARRRRLPVRVMDLAAI